MIDYRKLNSILGQYKRYGKISKSIGLARGPEPLVIKEVSGHARDRALQRGIHVNNILDTAQGYINNSLIMMVQGDDAERRLYISLEGNAAVLVSGCRLITVYPSSKFDNSIKNMLKAVSRCADRGTALRIKNHFPALF